MKQKYIFILLFTFLKLVAFGQISPSQMVTNMGRGINIGNVLSAPIEGNWAPVLTESYIEDVAAVGFKTVRIPIDFFGTRTSGDTSNYSKISGTSSNYTGSLSDYTVSSSYLDRIEEVINWSLNQGLITILDFHGSKLKSEFTYTFSAKDKWSAYYTHPTSSKRAADNQKFRAIWTQIANRFKDYSDNLIFEVINEPYFWLSDNEMDVLNADIISIVRNSGSKNNDRNIIITGGSKNSYEAPTTISSTVLNSDDNLIATFHYYNPRAFTASGTEPHNDYDWGTAQDKQTIDADFNIVATWSNNNNIPIFLGEFGADNEGGYNYASETYGDFGGPTETSRNEFHKYLAEKAIALNFSFAAWDAGDKSNKTIYKVTDRSWVVGVRNALLGSTLGDLTILEPIQITIYPNPAKNIINLSSNKSISRISLYDLLGKEKEIPYFRNKNITLPNLRNGTYFLKILFKDNTINNSKILISKNQ